MLSDRVTPDCADSISDSWLTHPMTVGRPVVGVVSRRHQSPPVAALVERDHRVL